ncbi:Alcohol dehydrogenase superfamily [Macleaya cordata]|uniref:Alcohol dehydrogenase superfamily n=1 Tax=Macleaya cordata TaxID=56857 RepID=A0A200QKX3_MACCD|nr:Alcohol dehydrogenase superfamily [Macleaya cordata]
MHVRRLFSSVRSSKMRHPSMTKLGFRFIVTNCRAVVLPRFGGPEVLEIRPDVKVPDLKPHEVLVRTRAVGEVASIGSSVRSLSVGQDVFGALHPTAVRGTYTDYAILAEDELAPKPPSVSHVDASAIPFAALTAWRALKSTARIAEGQRLLVIGGGGAVGLSAIQLAVAAGCHVSTTCGDQSIDQVLAAGAEQAIDYIREDVEIAIKGQFDAVLDTIGVPETERLGINLLKRGGHYMTLQGEAASISDSYGIAVGIPLSTAILLKKQIQYRYSHGIEYWWTYMRADSEGLDEIRRLSEAGKLKIPVEKTFPITQVREAHEAKDERLIVGKVVLEVD